MTDDELQQAIAWFENRLCSAVMPGAREMFGIALSALREKLEHPNGCRCQCGDDPDFCGTCSRIRLEAIKEKLEREKGCELCRNPVKWDAYYGYEFPYVYCSALVNPDRKIKVRVCPNCGRELKLEETANG